MKRFLSVLFLLLCVAFVSQMSAQQKRFELYGIGFYNLENLFDTIHDEGKNDYEFLPDGTNKWGTMKYVNKVKNII